MTAVLPHYLDSAAVDRLNDWQVREFFPTAALKWNKYIPHHPLYPMKNLQQYAFLLDNAREVFYGGQAGGGKSDGLLMAGLQYADVPGYHGIIFRRSYADLKRAGGLIPRSKEWLAPWRESGEVHWDGQRWLFPNDSTLEFGYLDSDDDIYRYQGGDWVFAAFDELTQFKQEWYRYIFSRMRRNSSSDIPVRMRSGSNPGGVGHEWVKARFITVSRSADRHFIPSSLEDNPYLDAAEYEESLSELDPVTYRQLRHGDWNVRAPGAFFTRERFHMIDEPPQGARPIRMWDFAATKHQSSAYTAGALVSWHKQRITIHDVVRIKGDPGEVEAVVKQTAMRDGRNVPIWMEQEPGSGGVNTLYRFQRYVLAGWAVHPYVPRHDKLTRAAPLSAYARSAGIDVVVGRWNAPYIDELVAFPDGFRDQTDVSSAAYQVLTSTPELRLRSL